MSPTRFGRVMLALVLVSCGSAGVRAAEPNHGSYTAGDKQAVFKEFVALPGTASDEPRIIVLATGRKLSADVLKRVQKKEATENVDVEVGQPHLKLVLHPDGAVHYLFGQGTNSSFGTNSKDLKSTVVIEADRVHGTVNYSVTGRFAKEVVMKFDLPYTGAIAPDAPVTLDAPVKPQVSGKFLGNDKPVTLKFVTIVEEEPFNDKPAMKLIFTEQDPAKSKNLSFDAGFGKLGGALVLSVHQDGGIFGCQVVHPAHQKSGFSAIGEIHMVEFDAAKGNAIGRVSTGKTLEFFGETWDVDLTFAAPLTEPMRTALLKPAKPVKVAAADDDEDEPMPAKPQAPGFPAHTLAFPKDATNVSWKTLVEAVHFDSPQPVAPTMQALAKSLGDQGWEVDGKDLLGKTNALMKRKLGAAELSIAIQPRETGSVVRISTEGLDWSQVPKAKKTPSKGDREEVDEALKDAKRQIKDALKDLPINPKDLPPGLLDGLGDDDE